MGNYLGIKSKVSLPALYHFQRENVWQLLLYMQRDWLDIQDSGVCFIIATF